MEATEGMSRNEEIAQIVAEASAVEAEGTTDAPQESAEEPQEASEAAPEPEATTEPATEVPAAPDRSWSALEDREQGLVAREKKLKEMMQEVEAYRNRIPTEDPIEAFKKAYQANPMEAFKTLGLDQTAFVEAYVNADDPTPDYLHKQATGEVKKVEERLAQLEQQLQQERAHNQALSWQRGAAEILKGDDYDKVRKFSALDGVDPEFLAFQVANRYAQANGRFLTTEEACAKLKATLDERWDKAFPSDVSPPEPAPKAKGSTGALTNDLTEPAPAALAMQPKSRREEIAEILKTTKF